MGFNEKEFVPESAHNMLNEESEIQCSLKSRTSFKECIHRNVPGRV